MFEPYFMDGCRQQLSYSSGAIMLRHETLLWTNKQHIISETHEHGAGGDPAAAMEDDPEYCIELEFLNEPEGNTLW